MYTFQSDVIPASTLAGVPSALAGVDASIQELAQMIVGLDGRLEKAGVLRLGPPRATGPDQQTPPNFQSSLANSLDQQRQRVQSIVRAISELQERIDL